MDAVPPRRRARRPRRILDERALNTRLVRVGFVVVIPAALAFLFSISTVGTLPRSPLAPLFDTQAAAALAQTLSAEYPARVPGTVEAGGAARWYRETVAAFGLETEEDVWSEDIPDLGRVELRNVVTVIRGRSDETIVLVARRDNAGAGLAYGDNASGTAALIELARDYAPRQAPSPLPQRTLVLVSTDAGAYGGAGAARFARESPLARNAIAAVVLDGIGSSGRPRIAIAGDTPSSPARALVGTTSTAVEEQVGVTPSLPSLPTQLLDLGIPFAAGEQGPFLEQGTAAVTLTSSASSTSGAPTGDPSGRISAPRLGQLGRASEALVSSLDASVGEPFRTPDSLFFRNRAASGWAARLALVLAVVPFALGTFDLLVRCRRRGLPFAPALRALRARLGIGLYAGVLLWIGAVAGVFPTGAALPLPAHTSLVVDTPVAGLTALAVALGLGWLVGRRRLVPERTPTGGERLAGFVSALALLGVVAVVLALVKPYALVFVLPSLYAWIWMPLGGWWRRVALFALGLAGPVLGIVLLARELGISVLEAPVYAAGLVTVGYVSLGSLVLTILWMSAAAQIGSLAFGRYAPYAGGAERPPPGAVRRSVRRVARMSSRRGAGTGQHRRLPRRRLRERRG